MQQTKINNDESEWSNANVRQKAENEHVLIILDVLLAFGPIMNNRQKLEAANLIEEVTR